MGKTTQDNKNPSLLDRILGRVPEGSRKQLSEAILAAEKDGEIKIADAAEENAEEGTEEKEAEIVQQADASTEEVDTDTETETGQENVELSRGDRKKLLDRIERLEKESREANQLLMQRTAEESVEKFVLQGIVPGNKEKKAAALAIALKMPKEFAALLEGNAPCVPVKQLGRGAGASSAAERQGSGGETFSEAVHELSRKAGIPVREAMSRVASERPELYNAHRSGRNGTRA